MSRKKRVLVAVDDFSADQIQRITDAVSEWASVTVIPQHCSGRDYRQALEGCIACIGWPDPGWIKGSSLRLLQLGSSGWDAYQHQGLESIPGFALCSAKGIYTTGLAEHALAMMLALVRRIPVHVHDKDQRRFRRHLPYVPEITGATACIVGLGEAGHALAVRCKGLLMRVTAVVRHAGMEQEHIDRLFDLSELKTAVSAADHVFVLVPGTPENERLFNAAIFAAFRPGAFFYNLARGMVVDEDALYEALAAGRLAGAGLDVTRIEPLPPDSRLWTLGDQVLVTGHSAGLSAGHAERFCRLAIRNLQRFWTGQPLENRMI